ncbi:hypothetical protein A6R68_16377, partial [Neotoma lepida]
TNCHITEAPQDPSLGPPPPTPSPALLLDPAPNSSGMPLLEVLATPVEGWKKRVDEVFRTSPEIPATPSYTSLAAVPLAQKLVDKCVGSRIRIVMKSDKEIVGTLLKLEVFVNMVLGDVTEFEITPEGRRVTKLDHILLNENNITMLVPGGEGPEVSPEEKIS